MLTAERLREFATYDSLTGRLARRKKPEARWGWTSPDGYVSCAIDNRNYRAHRLAWLYFYGEWPKHEIDHLNGDRADNRITNLRDVPQPVNAQNRRVPQANNTSGFLGVSKCGAKFRAKIGVDRRPVRLGTFDTAEKAAEAYLHAKRQLHRGCMI